MKKPVERLSARSLLRLFWRGLRKAWPAALGAWLVLTGIGVTTFYLRRQVEPTWSFYGQYLVRVICQLAITAVVSASLVAWLIHRIQPAALNGASPWRLVPRGWAASVLSNLLIQTPSIIGIGLMTKVSGEGRVATLNIVVPTQTILALLLTALLGFSLGEALTRRLGPLDALKASIRLSRGNRLRVLGVMVLLSLLTFAASSTFVAVLKGDNGATNGQVLHVNAAQALWGTLSVVLLTGLYLELRRIQLSDEPEAISETFD